MSNAAAARFAARYGLEDLPHTPLPDAGCPTRPTPSEGIGTPSAAEEAANFNDLVGECPTSPTCPHILKG